MYILKIESIINNLPKQKAPGLLGFTDEFSPKIKETLRKYTNFLQSLSQNIKRILPNSIYDTRVTLTSKPDENYRLISLMNIYATCKKIRKKFTLREKILYTTTKGFIPSMQSWFTIFKNSAK